METEKNNIPEHDNKPAEDNRRLKTKWMKEIIWTVAVLAVLMFVAVSYTHLTLPTKA